MSSVQSRIWLDVLVRSWTTALVQWFMVRYEMDLINIFSNTFSLRTYFNLNQEATEHSNVGHTYLHAYVLCTHIMVL